jgi:hypothetical protein
MRPRKHQNKTREKKTIGIDVSSVQDLRFGLDANQLKEKDAQRYLNATAHKIRFCKVRGHKESFPPQERQMLVHA